MLSARFTAISFSTQFKCTISPFCVCVGGTRFRILHNHRCIRKLIQMVNDIANANNEQGHKCSLLIESSRSCVNLLYYFYYKLAAVLFVLHTRAHVGCTHTSTVVLLAMNTDQHTQLNLHYH